MGFVLFEFFFCLGFRIGSWDQDHRYILSSVRNLFEQCNLSLVQMSLKNITHSNNHSRKSWMTKSRARTHRYWLNPWNRFDFVVVILSLAGYPIRILSGANVGANVIRIFRVARIFRLIKGIPTLQSLFDTLVMSMGALWNVSCFILVSFFIFSVCATEFFGRVQLDPDYLTKFSNFRHVPVSMLTLFRVSTADDWTRISVGCDLQPPQCDASCPTSHHVNNFCDCGYTWAPWFFVVFVIVAGIVLLNLFVAVVLDAFSKSNDVLAKDIFFRTANLWALTWQSMDIEGTGILGWRSMYKVLEQSPAPWGFGLLHVRDVGARSARISFISLGYFEYRYILLT